MLFARSPGESCFQRKNRQYLQKAPYSSVATPGLSDPVSSLFRRIKPLSVVSSLFFVKGFGLGTDTPDILGKSSSTFAKAPYWSVATVGN